MTNKPATVELLSQQDYIARHRACDFTESDDEILRYPARNLSIRGQVIILVNQDVFPEDYVKYIVEHEIQESYIARKQGFNLWARAKREFKKTQGFDDSSNWDQSGDSLLELMAIFTFEFRHEFAIYKEYQLALQDGILEEYHQYVQDRNTADLTTNSDPKFQEAIHNDIKIRNSIFQKLTTGSKHYFLKQ